jgi:ribose transport system permease protein
MEPKTMKKFSNLTQVIALSATCLLFAVLLPQTFPTLRNSELVLRQTTIVGICALGMTGVIISGGIDLSVGSVVALTTVVIATLLNAKVDPAFAAAGGVLVGLAVGLVNGTLVAKGKLAPFMVTLITLLAARGIAKGISHEQKVDAPLSWLNNLLATLPSDQRWQILPTGVWLFIALAVVLAVMLTYTKWGLQTIAIGSNQTAARLCGVPVEKMQIAVYAASGFLAGIAGVMQFSRLTVGDPTVATGVELDAIAAVVIGGGSLSGGRGSILGTILGALLMTVIRAGATQLGLPTWVQDLVTAGIILVAISVDRLRVSQAAKA